MAVVVLDATGDDLHVDLVVTGWAQCGLVEPLAWASRRDDGFEWRLLGIDQDDRETRGEVINALGVGRSALQVIVVAESEADAVVVDLIAELDRLRVGAGFDVDGVPTNLNVAALVVPRRVDERWQLTVPAGLETLPGLSEIFVVSPEDGPTPDRADELAERPVASVAAHCLMAICENWSFEGSTSGALEMGPPLGDARGARLVRAWTRIIDTGYLLDHVVQLLPDLPDTAGETDHQRRRRLERVTDRLLECPEVTVDLEPAERPDVPALPSGWAYVGRFLLYAWWRFVPVFAKHAFVSVFGRVRDWLQRMGEWAATRLLRRRPDTASHRARRQQPAVGPLAAAKHNAAEALRALDGPGDVAQPPNPAADLWRNVLELLLEAIDAEELSVDEAVQVHSTELDGGPLAALHERYTELSDLFRAELESHLVGFTSDEAPTEDDQEQPSAIRRILRFVRRRWARLLASIAIIGLGIALLVASPVFGAIVVAAGLVVGFAGGWIWRILSATGRELRDGFAEKHDVSLERLLAEDIRVLTAELVRFSYRADATVKWADAIRSVLRSVRQGGVLSGHQLGEFEPGSAPRSMDFAAGVADDDTVAAIAKAVRSNQDRPLFTTLWNLVVADHPDVYDDVTRETSRGPLAALTSIDLDGLPRSVAEQARSFVWQVMTEAPMSCLTGAAPWHRKRNPKGLEQLSQGEIGPRGPVGRGGASIGDAVDDARATFDAAAIHLDAAAGDARMATRLADGVLLTALVCIESQAEQSGPAWTTSGDVAVAFTEESRTSRGDPVVGGVRSVQIGRRVLVGVQSARGVSSTTATIKSVSPGGGFEIDVPLVAGSPVIDVSRSAIIGVATGVAGHVVGPVDLRVAILAERLAHRETSNDLDPGVLIPLDVLVATSSSPELEPPGATPLESDLIDPETWLGEVAAGLQSAFPPLLFVDGAHDDVAVTHVVRDGVSRRRGDRLLLAATTVQTSAKIPLGVFTQQSPQRPGGDDRDGPRGVKLGG